MVNARPPEGYSYGSSDYPYSLRGRKPGEMPFVPPEEIPDETDPENLLIRAEEESDEEENDEEEAKKELTRLGLDSSEVSRGANISEVSGQGSINQVGLRKAVLLNNKLVEVRRKNKPDKVRGAGRKPKDRN